MKPIALVLVVIFLATCTGYAQNIRTVRVKAGTDLLEVLGKEIYEYPAFTEGVVRFKPGNSTQAKLNFNMLNGEMQFLTPRGDTLSLAEEHTIDYIALGADSFRFDKGYIHQIALAGNIKLAKKQLIRIVDKQKIGGYDQPSSTSSISSYNNFSNGLRSFNLDVREDVVLAKETNYYLGDRFNHFKLANRKTLLDILPNKRVMIEDYLKINETDFKNEADLKKLFTFLSEQERK